MSYPDMGRKRTSEEQEVPEQKAIQHKVIKAPKVERRNEPEKRKFYSSMNMINCHSSITQQFIVS